MDNMGKWITAFASAQREMREGGGFAGRTARLRWTANLTGDTLRLRFANASPDKPMRMGPVTVWSGKGSAEITFGGQPVLQLAPGSLAESDEAFLPVKAGDTLTVLLHFPSDAFPPRSASGAFPVERSAPGDFTGKPDFAADPALWHITEDIAAAWPLPALCGIDLFCGNEEAGAVAVLGDSITEMGFWTRPLEKYIQDNFPGQRAFLNLGIAGNRLLLPTGGRMAEAGGNCFGDAGLTRLPRDILSIHELRAVYLAMGVNDITQPESGEMSPPLSERCTVETLAAGFPGCSTPSGTGGLRCTAAPSPLSAGWAGSAPRRWRCGKSLTAGSGGRRRPGITTGSWTSRRCWKTRRSRDICCRHMTPATISIRDRPAAPEWRKRRKRFWNKRVF